MDISTTKLQISSPMPNAALSLRFQHWVYFLGALFLLVQPMSSFAQEKNPLIRFLLPELSIKKDKTASDSTYQASPDSVYISKKHNSMDFILPEIRKNKITSDTVPISETLLPNWIIKYGLSDLMDPFSPAIEIGIEKRLTPTKSIQLEGGYISTFNGQWVNRRAMDGLRLRMEFKQYFFNVKRNNPSYWGLQAVYKQANTEEMEWLNRFGGLFTELRTYDIHRQTIGLQGLAGTVFFFQPFSLELGLGLGIQHFERSTTNFPEDAVIETGNFLIGQSTATLNRGFWAPNMNIRVAIGLSFD